jgi:hypothetical protein
MRTPRLAFLVATIAACGGSTPAPAQEATTNPAPVVPPVADAPPSPPPPEPPLAIPEACAPGELDPCVPGARFADRICAMSHPEVALALFAKGSPWTRLYLRGDVDGWNAEGGGSARAKLLFDEEVIALKRRAPAKGAAAISVGGSDGYEVIRWDGNCYTLDSGEVARRSPPRPKHSSIPWKLLNEKTKSALLDNASVKAAYDRRRKECKGVTVGDVSLACEQGDTALSDAIVAAVKSGISLPVPEL